jgi:hypothetical protein
MRFATRVKNVILSPRETFQNILAEGYSMTEPIGVVLGITFLNAFLAGIGAIWGMDALTDFISERVHILSDTVVWEVDLSGFTGIFIAVAFGVAIAYAIISLFPWIINSGISHIAAKHVFSGLGDFESLLCLYGYTHIAGLAVTAGLILFIIAPVAGIVALLAVGLLQILWTTVLRTLSVREVYGLDLGQSFICAIMPTLLVAVFVLLITAPMFFFV